MEFNLIGVPLFYGCDRHGVENGPDLLRKNGIVKTFEEQGHKVFDFGNLYIKEETEFNKFEPDTTMKYLSHIISTNNNLAESVYSSIKAGSVPFTIGGDHALGFGTVAGAAKAHGKDFGVIWIDAHGDINTEASSPSGNTHGMPLGASMGYGAESVKNIYFEGVKVDPSKVILIAQRDLDEGEVELIKEQNIVLFDGAFIREHGMEETVKRSLEAMKAQGVNNYHLSFDIDAMDSLLVPGTGTPVTGGPDVAATKYLLDSLIQTEKIKSFDFAEYNPGLEYEITTKNCMEVLRGISESFAKVK
ncbi:MAG: arginase [Sarcina sp.]